MKKVLFTLALAALPAAAFAQGIDLTWKDCVGTGNEATNQNFVCTGTANQNYNLIFQFKSPVDVPNFVGSAGYADYQNVSGAPLSPFWRYDTGACNNPAVGQKGIAMFDNIGLLPNCDPNGGGSFADPWDGDGSGGFEGIAAYGVDFHRPGNGYLVLGDARGSATPIAGLVNYYAFHLVFNNRNRTTCAGCLEQGVIVFQKLTLESNDGSPAIELTTPDKYGQCVTTNNGPPPLCGIVPVHNTSWGQIKSIYR
jgi:hypothetical protein